MVRISSLYGRTVSLIAVVFTGSFAVLALTFSSLSAHETRDLVLELEGTILEANGSVREFMITLDPVHAKRAQVLLSDADDMLHGGLGDQTYSQFNTELHLYRYSVSSLIETMRSRGFYEGDGLEGRMRTRMTEMERRLAEMDRRDLLSYLLEIRRSEKNYLLRRDSKYRDDAHAQIDAMSAALAEADIPRDDRISMTADLATYQHDFDQLVYLTQMGDRIHDEMNTVRSFLDEALAQIVTEEDGKTEQFLWAALALIFISFVAGILYAVYIARSIVRPLRKMSRTATKIANGGDYDNFDVAQSGEMGELATAFSELADQVKLREKAQTDLKASKAELQKYADELEEAKGALEARTFDLVTTVAELEEAKSIAEHTVISKTLYLANMSHEIRTPLNGIIGMTSLLTADELRPDQHEIVNVIRSSGESLLNIVNEILDFSKIEHGAVDLEETEFDLTHCMEESLELVCKLAADKHLDLSYCVSDDLPIGVKGDRARLRQILINLLANAVKFTEEGEVGLKATLLEKTEDEATIQFEVEDTGIGISQEAQEYLFDPFRQAEKSTTRRFGGTGLGLSIARHLAELMHGSIRVESEPGEGSTFYVNVKLFLDPERSGETVLADYSAENRALLLSRNPRFAESVASMIRQGGGEVEHADALTRAGSMLREKKSFDLVLINDGDNGASALEKARTLHEIDPKSRIVLFRYIGQRQDTELVSECISKPVKRTDIRRLFAETRGSTPIYNIGTKRRRGRDRDAKQQLRILVVEDNRMNQMVALKMLDQLGFSAEVAESGESALEKITETGYDVVFMDVMMPGMDGLETTRRVRSSREIASQPIIVAFTANATTGDRKDCLDAGMDDYIAKPVSQETFASILDRAKRERRTRHGARFDNPTGPGVA